MEIDGLKWKQKSAPSDGGWYPYYCGKDREWMLRTFNDGTQQVCLRSIFEQHCDAFWVAERVVRPKTRRKRWVIFDRNTFDNDDLYPPYTYGPFRSLPAAMATLKMLTCSHS